MPTPVELETETARAPMAFMPKIAGYDLIREKGRGPRAAVYKARRIFENDVVAVKVFHPGACDATMQARMESGVERTAKLVHPGLIGALGFGRDGGHAFLAMEYASGESLSSMLFRKQQFPLAKTIALILHCAKSLKSAGNKGFTHGRLHPGEIILTRNNVRISGVGMGARPEPSGVPVGAGGAERPPHAFEPLIYTPPEAMPSKPFPEKNTQAIDVYALGAILFHMLAGAPPFKGIGESSLDAERATLKPRHPVVWPVDVFAKLTPETIELVESMLSPYSDKRPDYDTLITKCSSIQKALLGNSAESEDAQDPDGGSSVHPASKAAPGDAQTVIGAPKATGANRTVNVGTGVPKSSHDLIATVPLAKAAKPNSGLNTLPNSATSSRQSARKTQFGYAPRSKADVFFSLLLFSMTFFAVLCVVYVTVQPQLPEKYQYFKGLLPDGETAAGDMKKNIPNEKSAPEKPVEPKQIIVSASPEEQALALRQLDKIQEMLRGNEILPSEGMARVLRGIADKAGRATPTGIRAAILAGDIESHLTPGKQNDTATIELSKALTSAAEAMKNVAQQPPNPPPVKVAEKPVEKPKAVEAPKVSGAAAPIQLARAQMKYFGYLKAKETIAQFATKGDAEQKRLADDFKLAVNYEEGLYERSRASLVDQIKKSPRHESPLQVFPRKDDPIGDDIINFDEKGLHILVRGGPNQGEKLTPWEKVPPAQVLYLLTKLTAKNNLEDQLGLAAFAFNRGLSAEAEESLAKAQALASGKDKANALTDTFARITRALDTP